MDMSFHSMQKVYHISESTHNQNTQPIQCHYVVSKEYIKLVSTDTNVESPHFPI